MKNFMTFLFTKIQINMESQIKTFNQTINRISFNSIDKKLENKCCNMTKKNKKAHLARATCTKNLQKGVNRSAVDSP